MHFVLAGLPAGPALPRDESCAICLEPFQTNEHVQLTATCRHAFHAGCVKMLLRSQFANCLAGDSSLPCPLCRSPLMAPSLASVPQRERPLAVTVNATWLQAEIENCASGEDVVGFIADHSKVADSNSTTPASRAVLRRTLSAPVVDCYCIRPGLLRRAETGNLLQML